jgi:hypothetical protein
LAAEKFTGILQVNISRWLASRSRVRTFQPSICFRYLGDGRSSRLYRHYARRSLAFDISAFSYTPGDPGCLASTLLSLKKREAAEHRGVTNHDEVKQTGLTADELERRRRSRLVGTSVLTTMRGQASDTGSNWLLARDLNFSHEYWMRSRK